MSTKILLVMFDCTILSDLSCSGLQPEVGNKRAAATALKTPALDKKAKNSTPKKETGG
jgi:hypothetical protein